MRAVFFGVPSFRSLRGTKQSLVKLGRAVRYNLCSTSFHKGFPLQSLTRLPDHYFRVIVFKLKKTQTILHHILSSLYFTSFADFEKLLCYLWILINFIMNQFSFLPTKNNIVF